MWSPYLSLKSYNVKIKLVLSSVSCTSNFGEQWTDYSNWFLFLQSKHSLTTKDKGCTSSQELVSGNWGGRCDAAQSEGVTYYPAATQSDGGVGRAIWNDKIWGHILIRDSKNSCFNISNIFNTAVHKSVHIVEHIWSNVTNAVEWCFFSFFNTKTIKFSTDRQQ